MTEVFVEQPLASPGSANYDSKKTHGCLLVAEKLTEAVLLYALKIALKASVFIVFFAM